jgi:hypothetical protein
MDIQSSPMFSVGAAEKFFADQLIVSRFNLGPMSQLSEYVKFLSETTRMSPHKLSTDARRSKLLVISSSLRETLKLLPIVVLSGLTTGGKSTLREMLRDPSDPNADVFGLGDEQRTTIPQLIVCGESPQTYCVLNNLGLSDITIPEETKKVLEVANKIFDQIASANIIVVSHGESRMNSIANDLTKLTSDVNLFQASMTCPVMTCFNKADLLYDSLARKVPRENRTNSFHLREKLLIAEAQKRRRKGLPFDLVTIAQNPYFPRVFSVFDPDKVNELGETNRKRSLLLPTRNIFLFNRREIFFRFLST